MVDWNFMPSSYAFESFSDVMYGTWLAPKRPHGQLTVTDTPELGDSMLAASSVALDSIATEPLPADDHV
jgi:hypothetical protein